MNQQFRIQYWQDDEYAIYSLEDDWDSDYIFKGTLPEVEAFISLREKGYEI